jgi:flagellar biosynthesis/type III secretory pathway ATPase
MSMYGARGPANAPKYYRVHDVQNLQYYQDQVEEVIMVLDSNAHVVDALREFYVSFGSNTSLPSDLET